MTTVTSPAAFGSVVCKISTDVTTSGDNFTWKPPDPLLSETTDCDQLAGNIGGH
jgi:hypothetical protein